MSHETRIDLHQVRRRLDGQGGRRYWKSLEELAETPGFQSFLQREFPENASLWTGDAAGRRDFLRLMGASMALAGLTACTKQPPEKIVPYVRQPEGLVPGKPQFYATALNDHGYAKGVLVESHMGRPTKIEGNPEHPASLGAHRPLRPGRDPLALRPRPLAEPAVRRRDPHLEPVHGGPQGRPRRAEGAQGPGPAAADRAGHLAHPAGPDRGPAGRAPRGPLAPVGAGRPQLGPGRRAAGLRPAGRGPLPPRPGRRAAGPRRRLPQRGAGQRPRHPRLRLAPQGRAGGRRGQPPLRGRGQPLRPPAPWPTTGCRSSPRRSRAWRAPWPPAWASPSSGAASGQAAGSWTRWSRTCRPTRASLVLAGDGQPAAVHALAHAINEKLGNVGRTRHLQRPGRGPPGGPPGLAGRAGGRPEGRPGRRAARDRRQPGLQRPGRPRLHGRPGQGPAARPRRALPGRDRRALPLARAAPTHYARVVGRRCGPTTAPPRSCSR